MSDRCEWSDLPRETCAHCGASPGDRPRPVHPWRFDGHGVRRVDIFARADDRGAPATRPGKRTEPCHHVDGWGWYLRSHVATCRDNDCDGCEPCQPDHGHCTAREHCGGHLTSPDQLTCPRCIGHTRADLAEIVRMSRLLMDAATDAGVDSEAAYLAGPTADPEALSWRRLAAWERGADLTVLEDDDPHHPLAVLGRWDFMLREDYGPATGLRCTIARAADYLDGQLGRLAQDREQDWPLFAAEVRGCRAHLEDVLTEGIRVETGAPCPACAKAPALVKRWFTHDHAPDRDPDARCLGCDLGDSWRCPACRATWSEVDYRRWVADDYRDNADALTAADIEMVYGVPASTTRRWASETTRYYDGEPITMPPRIKAAGRDASGRKLYRVDDVLAQRDAQESSA